MALESTTGLGVTQTRYYLTDTELGGLLAARTLIGLQRQSKTFGETLDYTMIGASPKNPYQFELIKMSVVEQVLIEASYLFTVTMQNLTREAKQKINIGKQAYAFLTGTGLDILFEEYNIALNAEVIRDQFNQRFHVRQS